MKQNLDDMNIEGLTADGWNALKAQQEAIDEAGEIQAELKAEAQDDPAAIDLPALFAPAALQEMIMWAYDRQDETRLHLFDAEHNGTLADQAQLDAEIKLQSGVEYQACSNPEKRKAFLYAMTPETRNICDNAHAEIRSTHLQFERACAEVERVRALLRVAELAAGLERQR